MKLKKEIEEKIHQIAKELEGYKLNKQANADIGVLSGAAGVAL